MCFKVCLINYLSFFFADGAFGCPTTGSEGLGNTGWADAQQTWAVSTFSPTALGLNLANGEEALVHIDVYYGTDAAAFGAGFQFDDVSVTDARISSA